MSSRRTSHAERRTASITPNQVKAIHAQANRIGLSDDDYRSFLWVNFGVRSCKDLTETQAGEAIALLHTPEPETAAAMDHQSWHEHLFTAGALGRGGLRAADAPPPNLVKQIAKIMRTFCHLSKARDDNGFARHFIHKTLGRDRIAGEQDALKVRAALYASARNHGWKL